MGRRNRLVRVGAAALVLAVLALPGSYAAFSATDTSAPGTLATVSSFYDAVVLADHPVGYWRLDSASTVTDSAGGHDGSVVGTVAATTGATADGDSALRTSGAGRVILPWQPTGDASVELSFELPAGAPTEGTSSSWRAVSPLASTADAVADPTQHADFGLGVDATGDVVAGMSGPGGDVTIASTGTDFRDGSWHTVVWTRSVGTGAMTLYVDGTQVAAGTGATTPLDARTTLSLGVDPELDPAGTLPSPLDVHVDEVATYPSVLDATRVAAHVGALGSGYAAAVQADAPDGYWRLDDAAEPTAAATVGPNGSYLGTVHFGAAGAAAGDNAVHLLSGVGYVQVPRLVSTDLSLELWFSLPAAQTDQSGDWAGVTPLAEADQPGDHDDFGIGIDAAGHVLAGTGNPETTLAGSADDADGQWHHVVLTRDGSTGALQLYVDGALADSGTSTNTGALTAASDITVGAYSTGTGGAGATVDELAEYATVLTAAQVTAHYQQVRQPY